ncbi:hypothetical protein OG250_05095 [Streptomyces sp. NBC_00487]|uniref:hypothetical protein n=1 Tax=unclassified Streptomyces TaxID=2593676 RepID=UPI002DDC4C38|nr:MULTISPECIES: hypothetical protein [unclassified Streptomyces]WRY94344.1 hypothetical protein OG889_06210 [Streptomyces sp. NBC_00481]
MRPVPVGDPTLPTLRDPRTFDGLTRLLLSGGAWPADDPQPVGEVHVMAGLDNRWSPTADTAAPSSPAWCGWATSSSTRTRP